MNTSLPLGYCRVSTQRQFEDGHALERYIEQLRRYGVPDENIYWDVESGSSEARKGYNAILEGCRCGASTVVVPQFDRFTRSVLGWEKVRAEFQELGVELVVLGDGGKQDFESPGGIFMSQIKSAAAELQRNQNRWQSIQGHKYRRSQLKAMVACFGYKIGEDEKLHPNHDPYKDTGKKYWEIARELVEEFISIGALSTTIRKMCDRYGVERIGHRYLDFPRDHAAFKYWLTNPVLRGSLVYHPKSPDKRQEIPNQHTALITKSEWLDIQRIIERRKGTKSNVGRNVINPLAGMVFCSGCGSPLMCKSSRSTAGGDRYYYLVCSGAYPIAGKPRICDRRSSFGLQIQDAIDAVILALTEKAEVIAKRQYETVEVPTSPEVLELEDQIAKLESLGDPDLDEAILTKKTKLAKLREQSERIQIDQTANYEQLLEFAKTIDFWFEAEPEEYKAIFADLVDKVVSDRGELEVFLTI